MRFNQPVRAEEIVNEAGGKAFAPGDKYTDLYIRTATQMVKTQKFYGDKDQQYEDWITRVRDMAQSDPEFLLQLAGYVRNDLKLRTAPIVMLVEACMSDQFPYNGEKLEQFLPYAHNIVQRADEISEIIAYFISLHGDVGDHKNKGSLPNILKKTINSILASDKFNEYQLVKHDKNNASVKLRDVLRICHPKPESEQTSKFYKRVVSKDAFPEVELDTWEGIISKKGSSQQTWEEAIQVMPIFATLRNLRNFLDHDVSNSYLKEYVIGKLTNPEVIKKSRILPFRFYQAYKEIKGRNFAIDAALEEAVNHSALYNVPEFDGQTTIFVDTSGSMHSNLNDKSKVQYVEIGALFGAVLFKKLGNKRAFIYGYDNDVRGFMFGSNDSAFHIVDRLLQNSGGATYGYKCIEMLLSTHMKTDRIMMFSDMQSYNDNSYSWGGGSTVSKMLNTYRSKVNNDVKYYDIDLTGYGTVQVNPHNRQNMIIGGWSERIFDFMNVMEDKRTIHDILKTKTSPSHHHRHSESEE